ncbi:MAG TPA: hypothetical protein VH764_08090 [Gemmatimonadales bacterium]
MRIPRWRDLRQPAPLLAIVAVLLLVALLAFRAWDAYVEDRLERWAADELARQTDSAYRLALGDLSFSPLAGSLAFDSAVVTTDSERNRRRAAPLPTLRVRLHECRVSGLGLLRLAVARSLRTRLLACRRVVAAVALASPARDDSAGAQDVAATVRRLVLPLGLSSLHLAEISLPSLSFTLTRPGPRGGSSIALEHARFQASDVALDPRRSSVGRARLEATGLLLHPDTLIEISAARLRADFTDSTLAVFGAEHDPAVSEAEWARRLQVRRDRIHFTLDSLQARGVAYRDFLSSGAIGIRVLEAHGARLDVLTDRRIPKGPPRRHRTPQQVAAQTGSPLRLDTVVVAGGTVLYRERKPDTERPGVVSFEQVRATVVHLDLPSRGEPLKIQASARLMGEGPVAARAVVPLDAPDFRYELSGRLGRMPAEAFNRFLSVNEAFDLDGGVVEEVAFEQRVTRGVARTSIVPRYRDLSVDAAGKGGGIIGKVARGAKEFLAQAFVVRSSNPEDEDDDPRVARTVRRYDPTVTWPRFVWLSLKDGLLEVVRE